LYRAVFREGEVPIDRRCATVVQSDFAILRAKVRINQTFRALPVRMNNWEPDLPLVDTVIIERDDGATRVFDHIVDPDESWRDFLPGRKQIGARDDGSGSV
jgi:hypothetical protein